MKNLHRNYTIGLILFSFAPIVWCVMLMLFSFIVISPISAKAERRLVSELEIIEPPSFPITGQETKYLHDEGAAHAYTSFYSDSSESEIFDYYDHQLKRQNWVFLKEGHYLYTSERNYCKDNFSAYVVYQGGKHYEVSLSAHSFSGCPLVIDEYFLLASPFDYIFTMCCLGGVMFSSLIIGYASWKSTPSEFHELVNKMNLRQPKHYGFFQRTVVPMKREYSLLLSFVLFLVCIIGLFLCLYQIYFSIVGW